MKNSIWLFIIDQVFPFFFFFLLRIRSAGASQQTKHNTFKFNFPGKATAIIIRAVLQFTVDNFP